MFVTFPRLEQISKLTYIIPFGKYSGSNEVGPGTDEVLVGREGHRLHFIELLLSAGRKGAFLITGRRGAGKTSFVRHCIGEYEASIFKRFLRENVGRAFWDRVLVLLFWAVLLVGALLLSELAELLAALVSRGPRSMLLWIVLVPMGVALLFPCVYARAVFEVVLEGLPFPRWMKVEKTRFATVGATALVSVLLLALWVLPGLSSPAWSTSVLFMALAALFLGTQACSFQTKPDAVTTGFWSRLGRFGARLLAVASSLALSATTSWAALASWSRVAAASGQPKKQLFETVATNIAAGLLMLGAGLLLRSWWQNKAEHNDHGGRLALRRGASNYRYPGLVVIGLALIYLLRPAPLEVYALIGSIAVSLVTGNLLMAGRRVSSPRQQFRPLPRVILIGGAVVSIVLALQLAQPILKPVLDRTLAPVREQARSGMVEHAIAPIRGSIRWLEARTPPSLHHVPGLRSETEGRTEGFRGWNVFWHRSEALAWIGLMLLVLALLHFVQYEWIVRPYLGPREEDPENPSGSTPWDETELIGGESDNPGAWRLHRNLAELTLPWAVYRIWLPSIAVSVNLGFDSRLGARQVIQAMLVGLRDIYYRIFTAWSAGPANIGRLGATLGLIAVVTLAGNTWFDLPTQEEISQWNELRGKQHDVDFQTHSRSNFAADRPTACGQLALTRQFRPARFADLACKGGEGWFDFLYLDLVPRQLSNASSALTVHPSHLGERESTSQRLLLYSLLPYREPAPVRGQVCGKGDAPCIWSRLLTPGLHLNVYHVFLFFGFLLLGRWGLRKIPILPYRQNLRRIEDLLDSMTARTRVTQRPTGWEPARWIYSLVADRYRETEREPLDPRTVELAFLQILDEIQRGGLRMPGIARKHLNVPAPEITFVFDELDKLGTRLDPEAEGSSVLGHELQALQADQERTLKLRGMLADLKNILSVAQARFIFIGGRNLHDEWLADQTARQPLLTNIFVGEIYLPSLLTDHSRSQHLDRPTSGEPRRLRLHTRIEHYVGHQYARARYLWEEWARSGWRPSFGLPPGIRSLERFAVNEPRSLLKTLEVYRFQSTGGAWVPLNPRRGASEPESRAEAHALIRDFVSFLTLRSMGNPKRLKELLGSFVRPVGQSVDKDECWGLDCRHILRFRDVTVFRIQLIAAIYRHLASAFEGRMLWRDDKMAISIFFLSDFMFKFHRRAFSWANLERVDELAHIHRAPDLREIQEEMVYLYSERFLHRVLNGMYSFRFRSDVAREVEYLSRRSAAEMAALNFTLDESQSLKAVYQRALELREKKEGPTPGLVAGLGELYEFDQEYEAARHHYRRAIDILDARLCAKSGSTIAVRRLLLGEHSGMNDARIFLPWGEVRLRLMLQIGMTFEITRSLEHAVTEYRAARTLARAMVRACLGQDLDEPPQSWCLANSQTGRFHTLKHMSIVFQPMFAEAWASQKISGTVDTANTLIETGLANMREVLPFVQSSNVAEAPDSTSPAHSNLALTMSQLHNKAGDLYFFKGRQPVPWQLLVNPATWTDGNEKDRPTDGYLLRAHYHYAVSLHEIRRYTYHRVESSKNRLSLSTDPANTLLPEALPDYLWRAAASSINDMAEATLGRVSLFGILKPTTTEEPVAKTRRLNGIDALETELLTWMGLDSREADADPDLALELRLDELDEKTSVSIGSRSNWLGAWTEEAKDGKAHNPLIMFEGPDSPAARLLVAVYLCRAGARFFQRGGYLEDAAKELLQVCEIVTRFLWWLQAVEAVGGWRKQGAAGAAITELEAAMGGPIWRLDSRAQARRHKTLLNHLFSCVVATLQESEGLSRQRRLEPLLNHLVSFVVDTLRESEGLFRQSRHLLADRESGERAPGEAPYFLGDIIPPDALTLACSLGLWLEGSSRAMDPNLTYTRKLQDLVNGWTGLGSTRPFGDILRRSLRRHRYPLLNRLNGLQVLVDDFVLHRWAAGDDLGEATTHLEELLDLDDQYAAPLHFTPQESGTTCALFYLRLRLEPPKGSEPPLLFMERVFRKAERGLRASEEMFTLRRAFYESISDLYYLYDDFNDRQIHFKHALQMAGAELTTLLQRLLDGVGPPEVGARARDRAAAATPAKS